MAARLSKEFKKLTKWGGTHALLYGGASNEDGELSYTYPTALPEGYELPFIMCNFNYTSGQDPLGRAVCYVKYQDRFGFTIGVEEFPLIEVDDGEGGTVEALGAPVAAVSKYVGVLEVYVDSVLSI